VLLLLLLLLLLAIVLSLRLLLLLLVWLLASCWLSPAHPARRGLNPMGTGKAAMAEALSSLGFDLPPSALAVAAAAAAESCPCLEPPSAAAAAAAAALAVCNLWALLPEIGSSSVPAAAGAAAAGCGRSTGALVTCTNDSAVCTADL
jgi:hypothetical protein